jgi:hypothetical protein
LDEVLTEVVVGDVVLNAVEPDVKLPETDVCEADDCVFAAPFEANANAA